MAELIANLSTGTWLFLIMIIILSSFLMMIIIANGFSIKLKEIKKQNEKFASTDQEQKKKLGELIKKGEMLKAELEKNKAYIEELERIKVAYESKQEEFFKTEHKLREAQEQLMSLGDELTVLKDEYLSIQKDYKRILKRNEELVSKHKN